MSTLRIKLVLAVLLTFLLLFTAVSSAEIKTEQWVSIPAFGPQASNLLVKSGNRDIVYISVRAKLFNTTNRGLSWERMCVFSAKEGRCVLPLYIAEDPIAVGTIYVGAREGLFKSIDGGKEWSDLSAGILTDVSWIKVIDSMKIYARSGGKLYKTINGGRSWGDISPGKVVSSISRDRKSEVMYVVADYILRSEIFYSDDGGLKWQKKNFKAKVSDGRRKRDVTGWVDLRIHPLDNKLLFAWCRSGGGDHKSVI